MHEDEYHYQGQPVPWDANRLPTGKCVCNYCRTLDHDPLLVQARFEYAITIEWPEWQS